MAQRIRADRDMLEAALMGLQHRREEIEKKMAELRGMVGRLAPRGSDGVASAPARKSRVLSAAARSRIAAAQKKRWDAFRKAKAQRKPARRAARKKAAAPVEPAATQPTA